VPSTCEHSTVVRPSVISASRTPFALNMQLQTDDTRQSLRCRYTHKQHAPFASHKHGYRASGGWIHSSLQTRSCGCGGRPVEFKTSLHCDRSSLSCIVWSPPSMVRVTRFQRRAEMWRTFAATRRFGSLLDCTALHKLPWTSCMKETKRSACPSFIPAFSATSRSFLGDRESR